jgi:hypothetical protein
VSIFVGVKDIRNSEFADRDDKTVSGLRSGKLVGLALDLFGFAAQIDRLSDKVSIQPRIGVGGP